MHQNIRTDICVYVRWQLPNDRYISRFIAAKYRVAPLKKVLVVRLQLDAAVLSKQLCNFTKDGIRLRFDKKMFIVDLEVLRGMLQNEFYRFNTFSAIQDPQDQHIGNGLKLNGILKTGGNTLLTMRNIVSSKISQNSCSWQKQNN